MNPSKSYVPWFAWLAGLVVALDQVSKYGMFAWLAEHEHREIIPGFFSFVHNQLNKGALFGIGNAVGDVSNCAFAGFSLLAAAFIVYWVRLPSVRHDRWLCVALGLILGGALGNLYDRLVFHGVRDFLWVYYRNAAGEYPFNWPVFNIADSALVCGAAILFAHSVLAPNPQGTKDAPPAVPAAT